MTTNTQSSFTVLSYNMQVAIGSNRLHHMLSHGWRYVMPHGQSERNLDRIAKSVTGCDIVALNEADAGSMRTRYINQAEYVSQKAGYPHWDQMITRNLGRFAQHSNSVLSRHPQQRVNHHRLPSPQEGRGVLEVHYRIAERDVAVFITHLSLSRGTRMAQMEYLVKLMQDCPSAVLMGDMNCTPDSPEMHMLLNNSRLVMAPHTPATFPSWKPTRSIDHILVSDDMLITDLVALQEPLSDHLAVQATIRWKN